MKRPRTRVLLDGGDPDETRRVKELLGFVDGQTTNPSLIARNPRIRQLLASGRRLTGAEATSEYRRIAQAISPLVGDAGVSIEVFADERTTAGQMVEQGREMFGWVPNAFIKYPCTSEGLRAAELSVRQGMRVNLTLCFSQQQAAAVYSATRGATGPVDLSPFVGRLDDIGRNGMDLVRNVQRMLSRGDGHLRVLAASIRSLEHLLCCFQLDVDLVTAPATVLELWATRGFPLPDRELEPDASQEPIAYQELDLERPWRSFDLGHPLTRKGIEKFVSDYRATVS